MAYDGGTIHDIAELTPIERWKTELSYAKKWLTKFHERGRRVMERYLDERDAYSATTKWFNLFHANTNILRAALYAQLPNPEVKRKYTDYTDQVARVAANILQRSILPDIDDPRDLFHDMMRAVVLDRLVPGLGATWLRLETDTEEVELQAETWPEPGEGLAPPESAESKPNEGFKQADSADNPPPTFSRITDQRVAIDYVYWEDFVFSPCRIWEERRWVGRGVNMSRDELVKRFGDEIGKKVPLSNTSREISGSTKQVTPQHMAIATARVFEIWDRVNRKVVWVCEECDYMLDEKDDFLDLVGFEPCPKPLLANVLTANSAPRPDFYIVQDQYTELDTVNNRISMLVSACKVAGVYDKSADGIQRLLQEGTDNILVPVDNWAAFAEKGGVKGQVDWLPLDMIVNTLKQLYEAREAIKQQIFELTGIADILRGASKASETLGAQQIKAKFASVRIKDLQDEVARFAADTLRIKAELMVKHFTPDVLIKKSNVMHTDDAALAQQAVEMLQSEVGFEWRIVVTSDQMVQADYDLEKQDRVELLTAVAQYLAQVGNIIQATPAAAPLLVNLLKWVISGFRGARDIEGMLDKELDNLIKTQEQQQNQPPKPDPEEEKAKMEMQVMMQKAKLESSSKQQDLQFHAQKNQQDLQANAMKHRQDMQQGQDKMRLNMMQQLASLNKPAGQGPKR